MSARQEAIDAIAGWCGGDSALAGRCIDSIPPAVLAELAYERGCFVSVGWGGCTERSFCEDDDHEWFFVHKADANQLDPDHPRWPVYRFTEDGAL